MVPTVQTIAPVAYSKEPIPEEGRNALDLMLAETDISGNFHTFYRHFQKLAEAIGKYERNGYDVKEYKVRSIAQSNRWMTSSLF